MPPAAAGTRHAFRTLTAALLTRPGIAGAGTAEGIPAQVGRCVESTIVGIGTRFSDTLTKPKDGEFGEGTCVALRNGVYAVSYEYALAVAVSRVGDSVLTCLVSIPQGCPKGDDRGRSYTTMNLRTRPSWTLPDSQHMCGGA